MNFSGLIWIWMGVILPARIILLKDSAAVLILKRSGVKFG
jgi:hypothetical protein